MLKEILDEQKLYTGHFFETLEIEPIEQLIKFLLNSSGMLFFTGVGKSGLVAKKIAFTMVSTGTRACYLSPTGAAHGDLGILSSNDVFVMLSKSGESDELLNLVPAIRSKGASLIGVLCNRSSRLAQLCDTVITLPFQRELCPFDMAPTMSTATQLLFGDLLTVALMRYKNFSLDQYALNHPSGRIGKRITWKVKDIMLTEARLPLCRPFDQVQNILFELSNKRCGAILIVDDDHKLLGIFTDGDLRRALEKMGSIVLEKPMQEVMTHSPQVIGPEVLAWEALQRMENNGRQPIMVLPVVDAAHKVIGILHMHDIIRSGL